MINEYIDEQEGEAVQNDSRFEIDPFEPLALQARVVQFADLIIAQWPYAVLSTARNRGASGSSL